MGEEARRVGYVQLANESSGPPSAGGVRAHTELRGASFKPYGPTVEQPARIYQGNI